MWRSKGKLNGLNQTTISMALNIKYRFFYIINCSICLERVQCSHGYKTAGEVIQCRDCTVPLRMETRARRRGYRYNHPQGMCPCEEGRYRQNDCVELRTSLEVED